MDWKKYQSLFKNNSKIDDSHFVLGIDLGSASSAIAYFDANRMTPETLDISGGYGKPTMPAVVQYITDTNEWVFGEYAMTVRNSDDDVMIGGFLENLGRKQYIDISGRLTSYADLFAMYLRELINNCKNINPRANITGIIVSVPSYINGDARDELLYIFRKAGYEKSLISFADERSCIFARYFYNREPLSAKTLYLDFGAQELRGGVYSVAVKDGGADITSVSSIFHKGLGTKLINRGLYVFFEKAYCDRLGIASDKLSLHIKEQLESFTYQHRDALLQKTPGSGHTKLYFNFAYPPFELNVDYKTIDALIEPYRKKFEAFIRDIFTKTVDSSSVSPSSVGNIICCGGGFEMLWARNMIKRMFPDNADIFFKNSTTAAAEGASIIAARALNIIGSFDVRLTDRHRLTYDIGVLVRKNNGEGFVPLIERDSFWWQEHTGKTFILTDDTEKQVSIDICMRTDEGIQKINELQLIGLPKRPPRTTRLSMAMEFLDAGNFITKVRDAGFGELFPAGKFEKEYVMKIE